MGVANKAELSVCDLLIYIIVYILFFFANSSDR